MKRKQQYIVIILIILVSFIIALWETYGNPSEPAEGTGSAAAVESTVLKE